VDPGGLRLRPLPLGSTRGLAVGAPVVAIGSPFGEEQSLSVGVISALDRQIDSLTGFTTIGAVQTDAAINQGNSGGPLLDGDGDVLGINSQIRTESGAGTGVGFAVPVDTVKRSVDQLRRTGKVRYAYLGISSTRVYPQLAESSTSACAAGAWVQTIPRAAPRDGGGSARAGAASLPGPALQVGGRRDRAGRRHGDPRRRRPRRRARRTEPGRRRRADRRARGRAAGRRGAARRAPARGAAARGPTRLGPRRPR
jgi:S1-C subfamily serine protease